ncbi:MAG: NfeD family protein [Chloroflexota bacterium]|nr:NfeD family protein [Dehalococcoidia bacterium]MDW8255019.1 NfeD family protein [Chloroflexota bacterium]
MPIPDAMAGVYLGAFLVGLLFTVASFLLGSHAFAGNGVHLGTGVDAPSSHEVGHAPSPFNLQVLAAFITFFGGVGYALSIAGPMWGPLVFLLATVGGLLAGGAIFWLLAKVIYGGQTPVLRERDYDLPGTIARVTSPIREGRIGEIVFEKGGRQRVEGARLVGPGSAAQGDEVVIVRYEHGIAYVEPLDEFFNK